MSRIRAHDVQENKGMKNPKFVEEVCKASLEVKLLRCFEYDVQWFDNQDKTTFVKLADIERCFHKIVDDADEDDILPSDEPVTFHLLDDAAGQQRPWVIPSDKNLQYEAVKVAEFFTGFRTEEPVVLDENKIARIKKHLDD